MFWAVIRFRIIVGLLIAAAFIIFAYGKRVMYSVGGVRQFVQPTQVEKWKLQNSNVIGPIPLIFGLQVVLISATKPRKKSS